MLSVKNEKIDTQKEKGGKIASVMHAAAQRSTTNFIDGIRHVVTVFEKKEGWAALS